MFKKLLLAITANRPARIIYVGGKPYLIRYYMGQWSNRTWYVHQFLRHDSEPHLHNHPWFFSRSIVLLGAYFEERLTALCAKTGPQLETRRIGVTNAITQADFHRIIAVKPDTWTLFFHTTQRMHTWGFFEIQPADADGFQPTLFHQPLRYNSVNWWKDMDCLTGQCARYRAWCQEQNPWGKTKPAYRDGARAHSEPVPPLELGS